LSNARSASDTRASTSDDKLEPATPFAVAVTVADADDSARAMVRPAGDEASSLEIESPMPAARAANCIPAGAAPPAFLLSSLSSPSSSVRLEKRLERRAIGTRRGLLGQWLAADSSARAESAWAAAMPDKRRLGPPPMLLFASNAWHKASSSTSP
jgi:hypothetical protein